MRHNHHGTAFFELLSLVMPDGETRKLKLERQLA
jgi:predicted metal-dependent hydrolase